MSRWREPSDSRSADDAAWVAPGSEGIAVKRVGGLPRHDLDRHGGILVGGRHDDFAGETAPALAQTLRRRPFFYACALAACWCARMMVLSMSTRRTSSNGAGRSGSRTSRARLPEEIRWRKRLYTASQRAKSPGRSRQGTLVRACRTTTRPMRRHITICPNVKAMGRYRGNCRPNNDCRPTLSVDMRRKSEARPVSPGCVPSVPRQYTLVRPKKPYSVGTTRV